MKLFALLPLTLLSASCFYPAPPPRQRPPSYGDSGPGSPYYSPGRPYPGTETGTFEPVPDGNRPPPPSAPQDTRPRITEDPDVPDAPAPTPRQNYPTAKLSSTPGHVISPYAPYNVIDVSAFKSGDLAKDPSNKKIFRVP